MCTYITTNLQKCAQNSSAFSQIILKEQLPLSEPVFTFLKSTMETPEQCPKSYVAKKMSEICSKLTIKTLELQNWRSFGVLIVNFEHILHIILVFPLMTWFSPLTTPL